MLVEVKKRQFSDTIIIFNKSVGAYGVKITIEHSNKVDWAIQCARSLKNFFFTLQLCLELFFSFLSFEIKEFEMQIMGDLKIKIYRSVMTGWVARQP